MNKEFIDFDNLQVGDQFTVPIKFTVTQVGDEGEGENEFTLSIPDYEIAREWFEEEEYVSLIATSDPVAYRQYLQNLAEQEYETIRKAEKTLQEYNKEIESLGKDIYTDNHESV